MKKWFDIRQSYVFFHAHLALRKVLGCGRAEVGKMRQVKIVLASMRLYFLDCVLQRGATCVARVALTSFLSTEGAAQVPGDSI